VGLAVEDGVVSIDMPADQDHPGDLSIEDL
jgi:hypothetical protein